MRISLGLVAALAVLGAASAGLAQTAPAPTPDRAGSPAMDGKSPSAADIARQGRGTSDLNTNSATNPGSPGRRPPSGGLDIETAPPAWDNNAARRERTVPNAPGTGR